MLFRSSALAALGLAFSTAGFAAVVTISSNSVAVDAITNVGNQSSNFSGTSIPASQLLSASAGVYYSKDQIDYSVSGGQTILSNVLDQKRSGTLNNFTRAIAGSMFFTVNADTSYAFSGQFNVDDVSTAGREYFLAYLRDNTIAAYLTYNEQASQATVDESFTLGGSGGDITNTFTGSLSGTLLAGHNYEWGWNAYTQANPDPDGGASATGNFVLKIGSQAVPEPASLALVLLAGGIGAVASRRRAAA